ncbi:MAG: bifunctional DedA family/phosphatase PAP2 family protein [Halopseudomonas sp.]
MAENLTTLIDWLSQNPQWIAVAIGATAFIESLAMIGVIIPGVAILYAGSALSGSLGLSLWDCLLAAMAGAVAGDVLSFLLGRYAHQPAMRHWPFKQHPDWIQRGEQFIQRHGVASVVIGRFVGPLRPVLPFVAGMLQMRPRHFLLINIASAALWSPAYILPGYLFGHFGRVGLEQAASSGLLNLLLLGLIVLTLAAMYGLHHWLHPEHPHHQKLSKILRLESFRSPRTGELPLGSALILAVCAGLFGLLTVSVALGNPLTPIDQALTGILQHLRNETLDQWMVGLTLVGDGVHLALLSLALCISFGFSRNPAAVVHWLAALLILLLLNQLFKFGLAIPRPQILVPGLQSFSFPSAHTSNSTLFFILLATFIAQQLPYSRRWLIYSIAALPALAIGLSRIYLGVHWFSDVLGGVLLGLAVCAATRLSYSRFDSRPIHWNGAWLGLAVLLISALYLGFKLDSALLRYLPA